jgi:hypothetical protein
MKSTKKELVEMLIECNRIMEITLKPSKWGIQVDKSKATKTRKLRGSVFPKGSGLNYDLKHKIKCPFCAKEMQGFELMHYKCKKCNEYFTN